ncbi:MAG TPA: PEPxxWA-CTERM sorting domain-containing protein [Burkholderiales bacterium]|nr:PEPxxWA-CTERM sorting domain-containing protein [Burkholderiales bacterium]
MTRTAIRILVAASAGLSLAGTAVAHVGYGSSLFTGLGAYDPIANTIGSGAYGAASNFTATVPSNGGFLAGLDSGTLGNTHDIRFRYFVLSEASQVSFTISGLANSTVSGNANPYLNGITPSTLNPAFSLYAGVVPASSHDGVGDVPAVAAFPATAAYLSTAPQFASWSPFAGANGVRGGPAVGTSANPLGLWGVFDANGDWTTGNNGDANPTPAPADGVGPYLGILGVPKVAGIHYLGISGADAASGASFVDSLGAVQAVVGADGLVDNKVSWAGLLGPGVYTLAIGGASASDFARLFTDVRLSSGGLNTTAGCVLTTCANLYAEDRLNRNLSITGFTVTPVPEPGTWAMLLSGLALVGAVVRRRWRVGG